MLVFGTGVDLELAKHGPPQGILRQHALHGDFDHPPGRLGLQLPETDGFQVADVPRMVVIHLVGRLATGYMHLVGIDDNNVVAGIYMRRIFRLVLAAQATSDLGGQTPERLACGITSTGSR